MSRGDDRGRRRTDLPLLRRRLRCARPPSGAAPSPSPAIRTTRRISAGCARRARRSAETIGLDGQAAPSARSTATRVDWDTALDLVARGFADTISEHGPDAVAFYVSGQLLTEDYYVANKLMKGFIGSANIDTNSRLCMASSVAGHKRAFGADVVPGCYEDLEHADLVVLVGSNLAWCHPVLSSGSPRAGESVRSCGSSSSIRAARRPASVADLHLAIAPGQRRSAVQRASRPSRARRRDRRGLCRPAHDGLRRRAGYREARRLDCDRQSPRSPACRSSCSRPSTTGSPRPSAIVTVYSPGRQPVGLAAPTRSTPSSIAILPPAASAEPGTGPFSVTGQPNAMGGREVGGLANQLAAHLDLENADASRRSSRASGSRRASPTGRASRPSICSRRSRDGRIKALWIMATNPVGQPARRRPGQASAREVARSSSSPTSSRQRHDCPSPTSVCPPPAWGEKDGTVTNSERRISRQRRFLPTAGRGAARLVDRLAEVGRRMGFAAAFDFAGPAEIFREHATLASLANAGRRPLDLGGLADLDAPTTTISLRCSGPAARRGSRRRRIFADGRFATPDGRARFVATPASRRRSRASRAGSPLVLNTGRVRDHWHTMTRTGRSARLSSHFAEPFVEIAPG